MYVCMCVCVCRWHSMKDSSQQLVVQVSSGAADLLTSLRVTLSFVSDNVSPLVAPSVVEQLAAHMDTLLLNHVSGRIAITHNP